MSKNEIAVREHFLPSAFQNKNEAKIRVFVEYEKINEFYTFSVPFDLFYKCESKNMNNMSIKTVYKRKTECK